MADGVPSVFKATGEVRFTESGAWIRYRDESGEILVMLSPATARIVRKGDFVMDMTLQEGKATAKIGYGEPTPIRCERIKTFISDSVITFKAVYALELIHTLQKMRLDFTAKIEEIK
ncbi:MAG: hypothetical protein ACI4U2_06500 [Christensenellaceae bacterium]